jgi:hypothetical protein
MLVFGPMTTQEPSLVQIPWTSDQVESLNGWQHCRQVHPFTGSEGPDGENVVLIATSNGWVEREGGPVVQTWAHVFMADWSWMESLNFWSWEALQSE